jgi:hypothetical protein
MEDQTKRGCLTPKLEAMKLTQTEVRLIPYVHYCNINSQHIDLYKITSEEADIIDKWVDNGDILGDVYQGKFVVTRAFFDKMNEVLWEAYANK